MEVHTHPDGAITIDEKVHVTTEFVDAVRRLENPRYKHHPNTGATATRTGDGYVVASDEDFVDDTATYAPDVSDTLLEYVFFPSTAPYKKRFGS